MSRLRQRWRTPQNAISAVNGRIPRIKRMLNAYCTLRIFRKVYLVEGGNTLMSSWMHIAMYIWLCYRDVRSCALATRVFCIRNVRSVGALNLLVVLPFHWPLGIIYRPYAGLLFAGVVCEGGMFPNSKKILGILYTRMPFLFSHQLR